MLDATGDHHICCELKCLQLFKVLFNFLRSIEVFDISTLYITHTLPVPLALVDHFELLYGHVIVVIEEPGWALLEG